MAKILAFAGSLRKDSYNKKLVKVAAEGARAAGAEVTLIDLKDYPLPVYDGDLEAKAGIPPQAQQFKQLMLANHGLLIASPEYNSSIPGGLKNTLDWASRSAPNEAPLACFVGKTAVLMSASPGGLGGLRGLIHLRAMLANIHVLVLSEQMAIARAHEAFNPDGTLKEARQQQAIEGLGRALADILVKLNGR